MASHAACLCWTRSADLAVKQFLSSTPASWRVVSSLTSFESSRASRLRSSGCEREYERAKASQPAREAEQRVHREQQGVSGEAIGTTRRGTRRLRQCGRARAEGLHTRLDALAASSCCSAGWRTAGSADCAANRMGPMSVSPMAGSNSPAPGYSDSV
jgi:hypothetical protein